MSAGGDERVVTHGYLNFDQVRVPADSLLGAPGQAFVVAQVRLSGGRIHHAMRTIGQARKALDMMCERALSRVTQGELLARKQLVQEKIADSWIELEQFRLLVLRTACLIDRHNDYKLVGKDIAAVKAQMPKVLHDIASRALHLHGSLGLSSEMPFAHQVLASYFLVVRSIISFTNQAIPAMSLPPLLEVVMARKSERAALVLTPEVRSTLKELAASRSAQTREVARAKVMLGYADGVSITELQRRLGFSRPMIYRCVDKALATGVQAGLKDKYHRPHEPEISDEAKAWVVSVACTMPKDHGLAAELWSVSALARFVSEQALGNGFPRLSKAGKSTVWRILDDNDIKPHKVRY